MNTFAVSGALAHFHAAYSRTLSLPVQTSLVQALDWSAQLLPQLYEYCAGYAPLKLFRNSFSATTYCMVTDQVSDLERALASSATEAAGAPTTQFPISPGASTPVPPHLTIPVQTATGARGAASGTPRSGAAEASAMSTAGPPYTDGSASNYAPHSL